jgi:CheY-like chemotaxis protein
MKLGYNQLMSPNSQAIVAMVSDVSFAALIERVAGRLGYQVYWIERADQIAEPGEQKDDLYDDGVIDPETWLLERLTRLHPVLILIDLNSRKIPWRQWVAWIKTSPATRRIPLLCFGAHKEKSVLAIAKSLGADAVVARSYFMEALPELIQKYALQRDHEELVFACQQALADLAMRGIEEFNHGKYYEAHELLEEAWKEDQTPGRDLYQGILQVAVAYMQIERGNYRGAVKMFLRLRQWIDLLPDVCRGVDVAQLRMDAENVFVELTNLGEERIGEFDRRLFKPVRYR